MSVEMATGKNLKRIKVFIGKPNKFYEDAGYKEAGQAKVGGHRDADRVPERAGEKQEKKTI